jgi:hypothetical protein
MKKLGKNLSVESPVVTVCATSYDIKKIGIFLHSKFMCVLCDSDNGNGWFL